MLIANTGISIFISIKSLISDSVPLEIFLLCAVVVTFIFVIRTIRSFLT